MGGEKLARNGSGRYMLRRVNVETNAGALLPTTRRAVEMFRNFCLCVPGKFSFGARKKDRLSANGKPELKVRDVRNVSLWDQTENGTPLHENGNHI